MDGVPLGKRGTLRRLMADKRWDSADFHVRRKGETLELRALLRRKDGEEKEAEKPQN